MANETKQTFPNFLFLLFILLLMQPLSVFETLVTPDQEKLILVF